MVLTNSILNIKNPKKSVNALNCKYPINIGPIAANATTSSSVIHKLTNINNV